MELVIDLAVSEVQYSLRTKLSISYVLVALISILLISVLTNIFLQSQFREYVRKNQEQQNLALAESVKQQYLLNNRWNYATLESIGVTALENGLIIKIRDASGTVIWDAQVHNNGMCQRIIRQMANTMNTHYPNLKGGYEEKPYPILVDDKLVGSVDIGYYGPFYMSTNDVAFIRTLNKLSLIAGILSMIFALILGLLMAKRLSTPISRVIDTAQMISRGYFGGRIKEKSNTKEICRLTDTVNHLAQSLENQEKLRKRLTADVAHELRTPLATLQGNMEAMIDGIWAIDADRLKSCHEEILRINRLVGDLEKLARQDSESQVLKKEKFNITLLAEQVVQNFQGDFLKKGVAVDFSGNEIWLVADRDKISQVLINLLSNALKYTPPGGKVNVEIKDIDGFLEIIVADSGIGISEADLPFIFERFYRADKSRTRLTGGAGIGLTIVKSIVDAHRGNIEVKSTVNEGTVFRVTIPKQAG
jgi:two-component system sensor histidine kinase BaeS